MEWKGIYADWKVLNSELLLRCAEIRSLTTRSVSLDRKDRLEIGR